MPDQSETEKFMAELAGAVDSAIEDQFNQRIGFSIFVWPKEQGDRANYVSNCDRSEVIQALETTLMRLKTGMVNPPGDKPSPTDN